MSASSRDQINKIYRKGYKGLLLSTTPGQSSILYNNEFDVFQAENVDISKLALYFTLDINNIPTTLVSTASIGNLQKNIDAVSQKLTDPERTLLEYIMDLYVTFDKLYNIWGSVFTVRLSTKTGAT